MILKINAPGKTYFGEIKSKNLISKFLLICLEQEPITEKVLLINPCINDQIIEFINNLALAEIQTQIVMAPKIDDNLLNAQNLAKIDIIKKIKALLPKNSFIFENQDLLNVKLSNFSNLKEKWLSGDSLIFLPKELNSFIFLLKLLNINLNGEEKKLSLKNEDYLINLKIYGEILREKAFY